MLDTLVITTTAGFGETIVDDELDSTHDAVHVFGMTAGAALYTSAHDGIARDVWLIMGGVVAEHAHIRGYY